MVICAALSGGWQTLSPRARQLSSPGLATPTATTTATAIQTATATSPASSAFFGRCCSGPAVGNLLQEASTSTCAPPAFPLRLRLPSRIPTISTSAAATTPFPSSWTTSCDNHLPPIVVSSGSNLSCGGTGSSSNPRKSSNGGGSFPARFRRCESCPAAGNQKNSSVGMTSIAAEQKYSASAPSPAAAAATQVFGSEQSLQKKRNGALWTESSVVDVKGVSPIATLPEEIPLEKLKVVIPPILDSSSGAESCSSDDDEVERRVNRTAVNGNRNGAVSEFGSLLHVQDSDTLVLGKNFHELSLTITEPEMDDEVTGDKEAYMAGILARYRKSLVERTKYHLGYPYNLDFNYQALSQLQHFSINNLGDPFIESNYGVHSRQFEVGVLDWFARLWDLEKEQYWGYITNCGTEGNLHGILVGREVLPDGILYASKDSHYSVFKAARMYRMEVVKVDTLLSGEIDCNDLTRKLVERADKPAILNVNIGTTVKGAVDDLDRVLESLKEAGFTEDRFYIHCDGALFGLMMPFVKTAPRVTFKKPIGSVSVSGHKFIGCPMPCGIQITRVEHINYLSRNVEYLASRDATIMGSRNGHAPLFLWYTLNRKGYRGFQKEVQRCLRNAYYLKGRLRDAGFGVMLNELSSTVVFERPQNEDFVRKWQLACQGSIAHAVVMPSVTVEKLDSFVNELIESRANCFQDGKVVAPCIVEEVGPENCACSLHLNCTPVTKVQRQMNGGVNGFRA